MTDTVLAPDDRRVAGPAPVSDPPRLADGVHLRGALQGAGFGESVWLIERADGQFVQVSELLYRLAERCEGSRTTPEIAADLSDSTRWAVTTEQVERLLATKLLPLRLLPGVDDQRSHPNVQPAAGGLSSTGSLGAHSPLRLTARRRLLGPTGIDLISTQLRVLFKPSLVGVILTLVLLSRMWMYGAHGLTAGARQMFAQPSLFLVLMVVLLCGTLFHEFGHAAALRYGGGRARSMGAGFYMIFPTLYTDVTDSYRLPRSDRIRTDVGGPYFHLVFSLAVLAAYFATGQEFLLITVLLLDADAARQLLPFKRMDGYWLLADIVGLPDLTSLARPLLHRLPGIRGRVRGAPLPPLRRPVRVVLVGYLLFATIALPAILAVMIYLIPHLTGQAWGALLTQVHQYPAALHGNGPSGNRVVDAAAVLLSATLLIVQITGMGYSWLSSLRYPRCGSSGRAACSHPRFTVWYSPASRGCSAPVWWATGQSGRGHRLAVPSCPAAR